MLTSYLKKNRVLIAIVVTYIGLLALNAIGFSIWLPGCVISEVTGHECFGCGLNRAAISLLRADFVHAYEHNPLIFGYTFLFAVLTIRHFRKQLANYKNS